jgi:hypothetical protein
VTVAAAGDIACGPAEPGYNEGRGTETVCRMRSTSELLRRGRFDAVLALGDLQYPHGELANFRASYARTWGQVKGITRPAPGNHEYATPGAVGYYAYFGTRAGNPRKGFYSFDLGSWHLIALNSNCRQVPGGCAAGSPQERWLRADLASNSSRCVLAYWHHPRFSSGLHGNDRQTAALFAALYAANADVVLSGHDHGYERFAPQGPAGRLNLRRGIRSFVVGTGGRSLYPFAQIRPNSKVRNSSIFGVLKLTLSPDRYSWRFLPEAGKTLSDGGSAACH